MRSFVFIAAIAAAASALAAGPALDVKTGLWSMTTTMHIDGPLLNPETLAAMPPEVRARMDVMLQSMQQPKTRKICITAEKLQRGLSPENTHGGSCEHHIVTQTTSLMEVRGTCQKNEGSSSFHAKFGSDGRDRMTGSFEVDRTAAHGPQHITGEISGTWLAEACDGADTE